MKLLERFLLAAFIVVGDFLVFVIPICAIFFAYVILARPPWFKDWVYKLYE